MPGVKAVVTSADFPDHKFEYQGPERVAQNFWHITRNIMAREKALYEGHPVAAIAAISKSVAEEAEALLDIDYEILPHVIDVEEAMAADAPLLFEDMITRGVEPASATPSNISKRIEFTLGDLEKGFAEADVVIEKEFKTAAVHEAYIEPHARARRCRWPNRYLDRDAGPFRRARDDLKLLGMPVGDVRVTPSEIGGGFGGKTRGLSRADRGRAVEKIGPASQDRDEPRRGVQGFGTDLGRVDVGQDRRQKGRHDDRR